MSREKNKSDEILLSIIKKHNALTQSEIEEKLNYSRGSLTLRLRRLITEDKLKSIRLPNRSTHPGSYILFKGYTNLAIYYINDDDFIGWIKERLPARMPERIRRLVTLKLHDIGIDIELSPRKESRLVSIKIPTHNKLKEISEKRGMYLQDLIEEILSSYLKDVND